MWFGDTHCHGALKTTGLLAWVSSETKLGTLKWQNMSLCHPKSLATWLLVQHGSNKELSKLCTAAPLWGESTSEWGFPPKEQVMWKACPCHHIFISWVKMFNVLFTWTLIIEPTARQLMICPFFTWRTSWNVHDFTDIFHWFSLIFFVFHFKISLNLIPKGLISSESSLA